MLGKCPPIYHRSEPEADDANSDLDSDNQQAAVGEQQTKKDNNNKKRYICKRLREKLKFSQAKKEKEEEKILKQKYILHKAPILCICDNIKVQ